MVKALKGRRCGCVKDDSEHAIFESGEKEVWKGDTDDFFGGGGVRGV